ncbi:hypothetical protein Daus18300_000383 [Diaporthe australafricana]|uniref:Uncharacterized protein n=1 Tax=Diaporthe australafricana TaxID=127596 RepID=A0ABR3Y5W0_9PEZI
MQLSNLVLVLANLASITLGLPTGEESAAHTIEARTDAVSLPSGADGARLHIWQRLDTTDAVYDSRAGVDHTNLNLMMKAMGGAWLKRPNGDGAAINPYGQNYKKLDGQRVTYVGQLAAGVTQETVEAQLASIMNGKTYNHASFSCKTVAQQMVAWGRSHLG